MKKSIIESLSDDEPPNELSEPHKALWWLRKGGLRIGPEWERAHEICQGGEGHAGHDLVHALSHRIEGDATNAAYWYRRAGAVHDPELDIESEWARLVTAIHD